ncbi:Olfactory guanylyl cyclase GC-D [Tetrabaena socialis]|uniref:Olfactory guanylyl cyclase GC-D n=1 Tax=Tetrabaena socialis TaxID=47790 RepID=A0A2J8A573_9CHLO|nr:Olfactory guanylyl cyclase GC-D [Tetrabaena socialis]|eukprot:PNH07668.1 Olfactory guanylyl cyclase GC-D [Tetrabaena socialis]
MGFLNDLYTRFDSLTDVFNVYKVETIGDCYMVAGGLVARDEDGYGRAVRGVGDTDPLHAMRVVAFARAMLEEAAKVRLPNTGDTINTASRMESTGQPGCIHISATTRDLLLPEEDEEGWASTGGVEVKGLGLMNTFVWSALAPAASKQLADKKQRQAMLGTLSSLHPGMEMSRGKSAAAKAHSGTTKLATRQDLTATMC